ncbi:DUF6531 domain-containing protein [Streptomyces sp. NPDC050264]|uniref:DUF6531 domain-containing protein n=1 Tax=Streptomyces sp. NPDC050264 TaxID=3155038 RepID=UPI0034364CE8
MGYTIPGWLDELLEVVGISFPNVDEDDYREMATAMREFAEQFESHGGDAHKAVTRILSSSDGWAVDAFEKHWDQVRTGHLEKLPELARLLADACDVLADIIFGMKTKAEIELGVLAATIAAAVATAVLTAGLSMLAVAGEMTAVRVIIKRLVDEAVDRIVDEVLAQITQPINAKLEAMVEDMVLDLADGAFSMPSGDGSGGGSGGHGGMQLASSGGSGGSGGGGPQKQTRIDHIEFEDGAGKVSRHGRDLHTAASGSLGRARGAFGRSKGRDPFTETFDSVLDGALKGSEKALGKVAKHVTETVPERAKATSRLHKGKDHDVRDKVRAISTDKNGDGGGRGNGNGNGRGNGDGKGKGRADGNGDGKGGRDPRKPENDGLKLNDADLAKQSHGLDKRETRGDPIDMASGQMLLAQTDVDLPGVLPLTLRRTHLSGYTAGRFFGPSWASTLDEHLAESEEFGGLWWYREDGSVLVYARRPDLPGDRVQPAAGTPLPLTYVSRGASYVLTIQDPHTGLTRYFEPSSVEGESRGTWWLAAVEDRNGNSIGIDRGEDDVPVGVSHSGGQRLHIESDAERGRITGLFALLDDGPARLRAFGHDEAGDLTEVRNAADAATRFTYDDAHRVTGWQDANDTSFAYEYDALGRVTGTRGTDGILDSRIAYGEPEESGETTATYTDSLGRRTVYRANRYGQIIAVTDPLGATTVQRWDRRDHLLSRTDPLGHTHRWEWDDAGDLVRAVTPDGAEMRVAYNELHQPVEVTDPLGAVQRQTFDERGNRTSHTAADGAVHRFTHHATGAVATVVNALGDTLRVDADAAGLPLALEDTHGTRTTYRRDAFGRTAGITDPLGATTALEWDAEGRLLRRTAADGTAESWTYDGEGNLTGYTDALGGRTRLRHGPFDLVAGRVAPDGAEHRYRYDTEQRLVEVADSTGLTWGYTYDEVGRTLAETDFDGRTTRYSYDAAGRPVSRTNAAGETIRYAFDAAGRLAVKDVGGERTEYSYDAVGRLTGAVSPGSRLSRAYDSVGRLTAETVDGRTSAYRYDALGRRIGRTTPTGADTETRWDELGNVAGLHVDGAHSLAFGHDPLGREIRRTLGDLVTLDFAWDEVGRLTGQALTTPQGAPRQREFGYRADGFPSSVADRATGRTTDYELDPVGRPLTVTGHGFSSVRRETYAYDVAGNQTRAEWTGTPVDPDAAGTRTFDGTRVLSAGRVSYRYDAAGRLVERRKKRLSRAADVWRYRWDAEDRLTSCTTPAGVTWHYAYDAIGRRTAKYRLADDGVTRVEETRFSWDGSRLAEEQQPAGGAILTWEYDGHRPLAQYERRAGTRDADPGGDQDEVDARFFAIVTDLIGAPTELVDAQGDLAWHTRGTIWGATAYNSDATAYTPLRHPGQYADAETGLHYNCFRHYDPETARYISPDPLGLDPAPNPLAYVPNPQAMADPLGLAPCVDLYHATNKAGEQAIRTHGVDPSFKPRPMDFGNGFYTTRSRQQAEDWANKRFPNDGAVLHFQVPEDEFNALNRRSFTESDPELSEFVRKYRSGSGTEAPAYDVVEGPMLRNPPAFKRGRAPVWSGDQTVFFGNTGPLLDASLL